MTDETRRSDRLKAELEAETFRKEEQIRDKRRILTEYAALKAAVDHAEGRHGG